MKVTLSRKAHFNAAHRLYRKDWTFEQNDAVFGKCNNPNFHGHNYELIVSVTGKINPENRLRDGCQGFERLDFGRSRKTF